MPLTPNGLSSRAELAYARLIGSLKTARTEREVLWAITREAIGVLELEDCVVYLFDRARDELHQIAAFGPKQASPNVLESRIILKPGEGIVGACAQSQLSIRINDTRTDPRYVLDDAARLSELAVPILGAGQVLGVIDSEHSEASFFSAQHQAVLEQIAALAAARLLELRAPNR